MKRRHVLLSAGFLFAAGLALFGDRDPGTALSEPAKPASPAARIHSSKDSAAQPQVAGQKSNAPNAVTVATKVMTASAAGKDVLPLHDRLQLIGRADVKSAGVLFSPHSWAPPPPPPAASLPPPPPTAPPLPFKYLGKQKEAEQWQVFLARADTTFIVKENDVIEGQYQVQKIHPPSMTLVYLPLKQTQSLTIE